VVALGLTVLLALALIALEVSGAPVLGAVVGALLVARELALAGWKGAPTPEKEGVVGGDQVG